MTSLLNFTDENALQELLQTGKSKIILLGLLSIIAILLMVVIIEVKHIYEIDLIAGTDFPIDNVYYELKNKAGL
jgi:hypothetical protein